MKVSVLNKSPEKISFVLEGVSPAFANALRRIMISELPALAVEDVTFFDNSSALYDEVMAHRLGLLPIKVDKGLKLPKECTCKGKGCVRCSVKFTLVKKGPGMVYSGDLKCRDSKIKVADDKIPLVKLLEGQKIKLEAVAVMGIGKEHAKWQPGVISYKYYPDIKLGGAGKEVVDACPKNVFELKGSKAVIKKLEDCTLCMACVESAKGKIEVKGLNDKFIFYIESHGGLKPEHIVIESVKILGEKAKEFGKGLK